MPSLKNAVHRVISKRHSKIKQQLLDALIFSIAAYESEPEKVISVLSYRYDLPVGSLELISLEGHSEDSPAPHPLLIGRSNNGHVVVACRGTADFSDFFQDLKILHKKLPFMDSYAHLGFMERAEAIDIEPFIELLWSGERIVFTGHSLGGAVASLLALRVLESAANQGLCSHKCHVRCITFGAPLFANTGLARIINSKYRDLFCHVVLKHDFVPKLIPLMAFAQRVVGLVMPDWLEALYLCQIGLKVFEKFTGRKWASKLEEVDKSIPGRVKLIFGAALRLLWPDDGCHVYAFAGHIVMLDREAEGMEKAIRLTKAEEFNWIFKQFAFALGFNLGTFGEHGISKYYAGIAKGLPTKQLSRLSSGKWNAKWNASTAIAAQDALEKVEKEAANVEKEVNKVSLAIIKEEAAKESSNVKAEPECDGKKDEKENLSSVEEIPKSENSNATPLKRSRTLLLRNCPICEKMGKVYKRNDTILKSNKHSSFMKIIFIDGLFSGLIAFQRKWRSLKTICFCISAGKMVSMISNTSFGQRLKNWKYVKSITRFLKFNK